MSDIDPVLGMRDAEWRLGYCRGGEGRGVFVDVSALRASRRSKAWTWVLQFSRPIEFRGTCLDEIITQSSIDPLARSWIRDLEIEWAPSSIVATRVRGALFPSIVVDDDWGGQEAVLRRVVGPEAFRSALDDLGLLGNETSSGDALRQLVDMEQSRELIQQISIALWTQGYSLAVAPLTGGVSVTEDPWLEFL